MLTSMKTYHKWRNKQSICIQLGISMQELHFWGVGNLTKKVSNVLADLLKNLKEPVSALKILLLYHFQLSPYVVVLDMDTTWMNLKSVVIGT